MSQYRVTFESPWYLLLLLLVPVLWWLSYRGLAALGRFRRLAALGLRSAVLTLFVLAAAQTQMVRVSDRLTVIYLLDQSQSIPAESRRAMVGYVNEAIQRHRQQDDRVGVIIFGRDAAMEVPPLDDSVTLPSALETSVDPDFTNLAAAMRLALASFPEDAARRIVVVSDGQQNLGNALEEAQRLAAAGVGVDVVPVRYPKRGEVIVERVILPGDIRRGQPFDLKVVITNTQQPSAGDSGVVRGKLILTQDVAGRSVPLSEQRVALSPGKQVLSVRQQLKEPGFYNYQARFVPDRPDDDTMRENNRATAFTHVQGKGQVLVIENSGHVGESDHLAKALREHNVEVTVRPSTQSFSTLPELQQFDAVLLANVPKDQFEESQVQMLVRNTQQMGAGLVMLGGPDSFGAGGWMNTELEKAMPVDFSIMNTKVVPRGALAMVMHASEIPEGNFWQIKIAQEALKVLGPRDYCGVIQYTGAGVTDWLWKPGMSVVGENRDQMLAVLSRMTPMDMPQFEPGLVLALQGLLSVPDAGVKHMIVISDGDPQGPRASTVQQFVKAKITISTVAVGAHGAANSAQLFDLATATGGRYYEARSASALPRIFQREARVVTQSQIHENAAGMQPRVTFPHEMLSGVGTPPPITGYVLTTRKQNPLVEISMVAPEPGPEENRTLLASWTYGLGRTVALTTDATTRWSRSWVGWQDYAKLLSQVVRWSMRPIGDDGKFSVATDYQDGRVRVVVNALDTNDEFLNFLNLGAAAVGPGLQQIDLKMEQVAPGRYVGTFPARDAGSYMVLVTPGAGKAPLRTGITVPYSDEFRNLETNQALLEQLVQAAPEGGEPGQLIDAPDGFDRIEPLLEVNSFRHDLSKATSSQDIWPALLLAASCLFFFDVFVRRVQLSFAWVPAAVGRLLGGKPPPPVVETIERLRSRKAEVEDRIAQLRASIRFEAPREGEVDLGAIEEPAAAGLPAKPKPAAPSIAPTTPEGETYTARLLRAKEKAREKRKE